jgi:hypothetical protein
MSEIPGQSGHALPDPQPPFRANNGSGGMFALSLRIAQPLARENAIFGGGHLSPLRFAERFQHFKDMIGKLSLSAFRPP